jgi:excinuclease ABC subunit A
LGRRPCRIAALARLDSARIKTSDWVIDLGPEGGDGGGEIVADGTPERVAVVPVSFTGAYLSHVLGIQNERVS